jgi:hypothetical protein
VLSLRFLHAGHVNVFRFVLMLGGEADCGMDEPVAIGGKYEGVLVGEADWGIEEPVAIDGPNEGLGLNIAWCTLWFARTKIPIARTTPVMINPINMPVIAGWRGKGGFGAKWYVPDEDPPVIVTHPAELQ